jgi:hypothetical protein
MNKYTAFFVCLLFCVLLATKLQAQVTTNTMDYERSDILMLVVTGLTLGDKTIKVDYDIRNNSNQDLWICDSIAQGSDFEAFLDEDGQTLVIRKRLEVPTSIRWAMRPTGKYVCLRSGKKQTESLLLGVPVNPNHTYYTPEKQLHGVALATRLSIEIGYYVCNLPQMYLDMLQGHENSTADRSRIQNMRLGAAADFNRMNESLRQRDDEVRIQYTYQKFKGEKVLVTKIDDLSIPYQETRTKPQYTPPDLTNCIRLVIQYEPSLIEYFYPYESEQRLLNKQEIEYLRSQKNLVIESSKSISDFENELKQTKKIVGGIVSEKSKANVFGYHDNRRIVSFIVYDDIEVETEKKQRIKYFSELRSLRTLTHQIQPFELRMHCADNLKNLWYRLRFYDQTEKWRVKKIDMYTVLGDAQTKYEYTKIDFIYPAPQNWSDALELNYAWPTTKSYFSQMKAHVCPGVSEGRSTYAMNPNCKYDSPPDTVLLFETKAGWNQHGGPELFTFDNHDPKGGCVLLNDGTVRFIRTKKELQQLRWK